MRSAQLVFLLGLFFSELLGPGLCHADPVSALARESGWLRLGHYQETFWGGYQSRVVEPRFFFSPEGRTNPEKELRATLNAFQNPQEICRFPARFAWIQERLKFFSNPVPDCAEQAEWRQGLGAHGVTLVYSSSYPNNPASMFGHTLLRLNKASGEPILNYGANFEARMEQDDPALIYAFKGLFGFYRGQYTITRYYTKVNEYSFSESRDLWEYDLDLSPTEVDFLVSHLWELYQSGSFTYYFLTQNCSFQLLGLLEAVKPNWDLTHGFSLFALPIDTIKRLKGVPGAIRNETLRPSLYSRMIDQVQSLNSAQQKIRKRILNGVLSANEVNDAEVLESIILVMDYRRRKSNKPVDANDGQIFQQALLKRATLTKNENVPNSVEKAESPLLTHDSGFLLGGALLRQGDASMILGTRFLLHDLADPQNGFPTGFGVEVAKVVLSYGNQRGQKRVRLEQAQLFNILSLHPANSEQMQFSWALRSGADRPLDFGRSDSLAWGLEAGPGIAVGFSRNRSWIYGLLMGQGQLVQNLNRPGRFGLVGEFGTILSLSGSLTLLGNLRLIGEWNRPLDRSWRWESESKIGWSLSTAFQLRLGMRVSGAGLLEKGLIPEWTSEARWYF